MPRNIMLPEEQQNSPHELPLPPSKGNQKRGSASSNFSEEDTMFEPRWKTNLLISDEAERVQRRDHGYRKNTSFQNKIINDHIKAMVESVCEMEETIRMEDCIYTCNSISCHESMVREGIVKAKVQELIDTNTYLTQEQKGDFLALFCQNYDNYQILTKATTRLASMHLLTEELTFILCKIIQFITQNYEMNLRKYDQEFMEKEIPKKLAEVQATITTHENVRLINPEYFYNTNEAKWVRIVERWFYCVFAVKLGVYGNRYLRKEEEEMGMMM